MQRLRHRVLNETHSSLESFSELCKLEASTSTVSTAAASRTVSVLDNTPQQHALEISLNLQQHVQQDLRELVLASSFSSIIWCVD